MAAVENKVCYSTWIDRDGDNKGASMSFHLPAAQAKVIPSSCLQAGFTVQQPIRGRIFFAPSDGVCWVDADKNASKNATSVVVNHLSLGKDATDKPLRTEPFPIT